MAKKNQGAGWSFVQDEAPLFEREDISLAPEEQNAKIRIEKRKGGRVVTVISDLVLIKADLKDLARELRNACGTGGTIQEREIELQGDQVEKAKAWLLEKGWGVRK